MKDSIIVPLCLRSKMTRCDTNGGCAETPSNFAVLRAPQDLLPQELGTAACPKALVANVPQELGKYAFVYCWLQGGESSKEAGV